MLKYVLAWFPMVVIAISNGVLRESWYGKYLSDLRAHQVSTLTAVVLLGVYIAFIIRTWRPASGAQAGAIGLIWLTLTVGFEFIFGRYVAGHSWERLLQDYDLLAGRLWSLVPVWLAVAPYLFFRVWNWREIR